MGVYRKLTLQSGTSDNIITKNDPDNLLVWIINDKVRGIETVMPLEGKKVIARFDSMAHQDLCFL